MRGLALVAILLYATAAPAVNDLDEKDRKGRFSIAVPDLFKKAEAGDAEAQFLLATAYATGDGAPKNPERAEKWYRISAGQGHADAQNGLGSFYQAQKKFVEARPWFEKAAAQKHPRATNNLGWLYDAGLGVARDRRKARELYLAAADLGSADAMWNIAHQQIAGQLENPDLYTACVWALRARRFAPQEELELRGQISKGMTRLEQELPPQRFARCEEEGVKWKPANLAPSAAGR
jgi:TPR repeat protein